MQRLSEDYREKSRYNLDFEQFLLFLSFPGESRETHKWPCACTSLVSLAKSEKKRETTRSLGTTWQSTLSRQLQFYLSEKASHGKFKHLSVLHNSHKWFIVIVLSDLLCDSSYRGTWKKIVQSGISKNERFSSFSGKRTIKIQDSTMQPLKSSKPFELTSPLRKESSNIWTLLVSLPNTVKIFCS